MLVWKKTLIENKTYMLTYKRENPRGITKQDNQYATEYLPGAINKALIIQVNNQKSKRMQSW